MEYNKIFLCSILQLFVFFQIGFAQDKGIDFIYWFSNMKMTKRAIILSNEPKEIKLDSGWACRVEPNSSKQSRITSCRKGDEVFEFSVMCSQSFPKDHTQIRFKNNDGKIIDYIEVGCHPQNES